MLNNSHLCSYDRYYSQNVASVNQKKKRNVRPQRGECACLRVCGCLPNKAHRCLHFCVTGGFAHVSQTRTLYCIKFVVSIKFQLNIFLNLSFPCVPLFCCIAAPPRKLWVKRFHRTDMKCSRPLPSSFSLPLNFSTVGTFLWQLVTMEQFLPVCLRTWFTTDVTCTLSCYNGLHKWVSACEPARAALHPFTLTFASLGKKQNKNPSNNRKKQKIFGSNI